MNQSFSRPRVRIIWGRCVPRGQVFGVRLGLANNCNIISKSYNEVIAEVIIEVVIVL